MNFVNNRLINGTDVLAGSLSVNGDAASEGGSARAGLQAAKGEDLMRQLMDNLDATNNRPALEMVRQALKEAGLPASNDNMRLVTLLLANEMPINKETLRELVQEQKAYPSASPEALVSMHKSDIPINSESVTTITEALENVRVFSGNAENLAAAIENALTAAENTATENAAIENTATENAAIENTATGNASAAAGTLAESAADTAALTGGTADTAALTGGTADTAALTGGTADTAAPAAQTGAEAQNIPQDLGSALREAVFEVVALLGSAVNEVPAEAAPLKLDQNIYRIVVETTPATLPDEPETEAGGETLNGEFTAKGNGEDPESGLGTPTGDSNQAKTEAAFTDKDVFEVQALRDRIFSASPAEIGKLVKHLLSADSKNLSKDSIRKLYETSELLFGKVREAAEAHEGGQNVSHMAQKASEDLKLLNRLSNLYPQVELPIKLPNPDASGSLYVYAGKKKSKDKAGSATALLHLSMPSLGPVDIKLSLTGKRLNMSFYTEDMAGAYLKADIGSLEKNISRLELIVNTVFKDREALSPDRKDEIKKNSSLSLPAGDNTRLSFDIRA